MKRFLQALSITSILGFALYQPARACNLSDYNLVSITTTAGPTYTIVTRLCIGYGRTGVVFGADGPTNGLFSLAIYDNASAAAIQAALVSWAPYYLLVGTAQNTFAIPPGPTAFTADPGLGIGAGQAGPGFGAGEKDNIFYMDPIGCYCLDYTCISTTADCGNVGQLCQNITLVYTGIYPDSVRALGIEGSVPFGGCWPNSDMRISFSTLPVIWGDFTGTTGNGGINLTWETQQETHSKKFIITRAEGYTGEFAEIGTLNAAGDSDTKLSYKFFDPNPTPGLNAYQLKQLDEDGNMMESSTIYVNYAAPLDIALERAYPNPVTDRLNLLITSDKETAATVTLVNAEGKSMQAGVREMLVGANEFTVDMANLAPGVYFLRISTSSGTLEHKVLKF